MATGNNDYVGGEGCNNDKDDCGLTSANNQQIST